MNPLFGLPGIASTGVVSRRKKSRSSSPAVAEKHKDVQVIVSLTSWRGRINNPQFGAVLKRLLRQKTQYVYKVVLTLSEAEFGARVVPGFVGDLLREFKHFEVLWTFEDTQALKNYYPVSEKYAELPIIVLGDDTFYSENLVEVVYSSYLASDRHTALCARAAKENELVIPWRLRLFPPHCMTTIPTALFKERFCGHNDLFYGIALLLQGTPVKVESSWNGLWIEKAAYGQDVALRSYHSIKQYSFYQQLLKDHPELLQR